MFDDASTYSPYKPAFGPEKDIIMMATPGDWPCWPRLPLKRRNLSTGMMETGYLLELNNFMHVVFIGTIYDVLPDSVDKLGEVKQIKYNSFQAIQADGWIVD